MTLLKKCFVAGSIVIVLAAAAIAGGYHWATSPLDLTPAQLDVTVKPHSSLRSVTLQLNRGGVPVEPELFVIMTRLLGLQSDLKSGNYEFKTGITPYEVLQKIARGDVNEYVATIIEGWTFKRMRAELDANPALKHDTIGMSDTDLMNAINAPEASIGNGEGLFFPDTYLFDKGESDLSVLRRAYRAGRERLAQAWAARSPDLAFQTPYEALIMASLVENETGVQSDRGLVSAVFSNRLKKGMPLQTDPSVIYGLGAAYDGHLHKRDLLRRQSGDRLDRIAADADMKAVEHDPEVVAIGGAHDVPGGGPVLHPPSPGERLITDTHAVLAGEIGQLGEVPGGAGGVVDRLGRNIGA